MDCNTKAADLGNKDSMTWLVDYYIGKGNDLEKAEYWKKKVEEQIQSNNAPTKQEK